MSGPQQITGKCLCGAIKVSVTTDNPILRACHCDMCRKQTSSMFMSLSIVAGSEAITGVPETYRSSEWAERGFCGTCGSTLWYSTIHDGVKNFAAGLFHDAGGAPLKLEFFADECPQGYALAGDHKRLTTEQTIALFAPEEGTAE